MSKTGVVHMKDRGMMDKFIQSCLIMLVVRNGGRLEIPVAEVDAVPEGKLLTLETDADRRVIVLKVSQISDGASA